MKDERPPESEPSDELLEAARKRGQGLLDRQKSAAVEELHGVADVMREAAHKFEERQEGGLASYVQTAADTLDRLSTTLRERDLEDLIRDAEGAFRRRPAIGLAATAVAGFVLGRFLRAGSKRLVSNRGESPRTSGAGSDGGGTLAGPIPSTPETRLAGERPLDDPGSPESGSCGT